jgi:PAS domain S-box-containing protein
MSQSEYREFSEANPDAVVVVDENGCINFANRRVEALLGYAPSELLGKSPNLLVPDHFRSSHPSHIARFMTDPTPRMMGAGLDLAARRKDGSEFRAEISLSPYQSAGGLVVIVAIREITGAPDRSGLESENSDLRDLLQDARRDSARLLQEAGLDAIEQESAKRLQRLLLEEVHHRMKNMLATVMAITAQSLRSAESLEEGRLAISSRLMAMGRAQELMLQATDVGASLTDLVVAAVAPFESDGRRRFGLQTASVPIGPAAVLPLTLSLNELCTNAVKYGALSSPTGRVEIVSSVDDRSQLFTLRWTESGGPRVVKPTRRGFGTRLLRALAGQLHGEVAVRYEPTGFIYQLDSPMAVLRPRLTH